MPGKQTQVQREQYCRRHRTEGKQTLARMSAYMASTVHKDDDLDQRVHRDAGHETWQTLFLSHWAIDDEKDQHVCETLCKNEAV